LGGLDWICLTQDRDQWKALVNTAVNLQVKHDESERIWKEAVVV
jgi:hypothetical protein